MRLSPEAVQVVALLVLTVLLAVSSLSMASRIRELRIIKADLTSRYQRASQELQDVRAQRERVRLILRSAYRAGYIREHLLETHLVASEDEMIVIPAMGIPAKER